MFHFTDLPRGNFIFHTGLYMDEKVKKKPEKYRRMIENRRSARKCYVITLPVYEKNSMEMYSSREFWFRHYRTVGLVIIGMAADRDSAEHLLCRIVQDVYSAYRMVDAGHIRAYFREKEG